MSKEERDIVYLYPKTSCPCKNWCKPAYEAPKGEPTNRGVRGCQTPEYFECHDRIGFDVSIQPQNKKGDYELNPQVYTQKQSPFFDKVKCKDGTCPEITWLSWDPRLFSASQVQYMRLDRPPMDGAVPLKDVYSPFFNNYGIGSKSYDKINDGQITYYVDKSIEDAFFNPVFSEKAFDYSQMFKDPMGSLKPEYNRIPISNTANPAITTGESYPYCLSFIQDTQSHREDLMALQMRRKNQERWMPRWNAPVDS